MLAPQLAGGAASQQGLRLQVSRLQGLGRAGPLRWSPCPGCRCCRRKLELHTRTRAGSCKRGGVQWRCQDRWAEWQQAQTRHDRVQVEKDGGEACMAAWVGKQCSCAAHRGRSFAHVCNCLCSIGRACMRFKCLACAIKMICAVQPAQLGLVA